MKKKAFLIVCTAAMLAPTIAWAQYPQLTDEAKETYKKMITEERRRSDEAWAKALPIVEKEAREGRPYIEWASRPDDLPQAGIPAFPPSRRACRTRSTEHGSRPPTPSPAWVPIRSVCTRP